MPGRPHTRLQIGARASILRNAAALFHTASWVALRPTTLPHSLRRLRCELSLSLDVAEKLKRDLELIEGQPAHVYSLDLYRTLGQLLPPEAEPEPSFDPKQLRLFA